MFSIHKNNHLIVCSQQNISYLCNSPLRVSMCYGTLPRGEVQASPLLFYKFSCLEEWSYFAFFINPHLLYIGIDICSCNNIFTDKPITASFYIINYNIWRLFHSMWQHSSYFLSFCSTIWFHFALLLSKWQNNLYHIVIVKPFSYLRVQEWTMHHHSCTYSTG